MQFRSQRNSHLENNLKDIAHSKHEAHISKDINMLRKRNQAYHTSNPSSIIQDETLFTSKDFSWMQVPPQSKHFLFEIYIFCFN